MKERIKWLDFGKGFTIFLVVLGHALASLYSHNLYLNYRANLIAIADLIFLVIMPIFFALSGFLFKNPRNIIGFGKMIRKKAANLLIPYVVFSFVYVLLEHFSNSVQDRVGWQSLLYIAVKPIGYLWFLYSLFFIFVIIGFAYLIKLDTRIQGILYLILFLISQFFKLPIGINSIFNWIFFFYLGVIYRKYFTIFRKKYIFYFILFVFILSLFIGFKIQGIYVNYNSPNLINFVPKLCAVFIFFSVFRILPQNKMYKYFEKYGKYSLIIYLVHLPVIAAVRAVIYRFYMPNIIIGILILVLTGWYISVLIIVLNNRYPVVNFIFNPYLYLDTFFKKCQRNSKK